MKVQFEFSPADLAEIGSRAVNRSPLVHRWRLRNSIAAAILSGLLVFAATPWDLSTRSIAALVAAVVMFVIMFLTGRRGRGNRRLLEFYRERLGGDGPFTCEVELTRDGVVSRQLGQESHHPWSQVASVTEAPGGIEFIYRPIGSLLVRDRAFSDPQARTKFLSLARSRVPAGLEARAAPEPIPAVPFLAGPRESDYFVAWLLFFLCASIGSSLVSLVIGAGSAAILRMPDVKPVPGVYVVAGISFFLSACLSYFFFRFFTKRLVSQAQAQPSWSAA